MRSTVFLLKRRRRRLVIPTPSMVKTLLIRSMSVVGNGSLNQSPAVFCW